MGPFLVLEAVCSVGVSSVRTEESQSSHSDRATERPSDRATEQVRLYARLQFGPRGIAQPLTRGGNRLGGAPAMRLLGEPHGFCSRRTRCNSSYERARSHEGPVAAMARGQASQVVCATAVQSHEGSHCCRSMSTLLMLMTTLLPRRPASATASSPGSKSVAQLLADLGVTKTHSRPHLSNDNHSPRLASRR